jgi:hypothetical protein
MARIARGGIDDPSNARLAACFKEIDRAERIAAGVGLRISYRSTQVDLRCQVVDDVRACSAG